MQSDNSNYNYDRIRPSQNVIDSEEDNDDSPSKDIANQINLPTHGGVIKLGNFGGSKTFKPSKIKDATKTPK